MKEKLQQYLKIFWTFFKVGILTFGGGYAMLPILQREVVDRYHWIDEGTLADYYALAQCEPGLIAVNMAVLISRPLFGTLGAVLAALGVVCPSIIIILIISAVLNSVRGNKILEHAFAGIRVSTLR